MFAKISGNVSKESIYPLEMRRGFTTKNGSTAVLPKSISKPKTISDSQHYNYHIMNWNRAVTARYFFRRSSITLWRFRPKSGYTNETCTQ